MADTIILRSGFLAAVGTVQTFLTSRGVDVSVSTGWKENPQRINKTLSGANRVVFVPSRKSGDGGEIEPARFVGDRNIYNALDARVATVRSLRNWRRAATVHVWAVDNAAPDDEAAQLEATEALFEWVVRAVHNAPGAFGAVAFGRTEWTKPVQRSFGLELQVEFTFSQPIYDVPRNVVIPDAAEITRAEYEPPTDPTPRGDT